MWEQWKEKWRDIKKIPAKKILSSIDIIYWRRGENIQEGAKKNIDEDKLKKKIQPHER